MLIKNSSPAIIEGRSCPHDSHCSKPKSAIKKTVYFASRFAALSAEYKYVRVIALLTHSAVGNKLLQQQKIFKFETRKSPILIIKNWRFISPKK